MERLHSSLDPNKYLIQIPNIKAWLKNKKYTNLDKEIGLIAIATSLHIVIVAFFVGEILGFNDLIVNKIKNNMKFYHIDELVGLDEAISRYKNENRNESG